MTGVTQPLRWEKNHPPAEANVREGAGGLLLLAAANETGLLASLETAIASCEPTTPRSLLSSSPHCRRQLLLTLLFLPLSGLHRTHDLRSYTGNTLAVVTGRHRAYGYCHTERFLSQLAKAKGSEALTTALGSWTAHLWKQGVRPRVVCTDLEWDGGCFPLRREDANHQASVGRFAHALAEDRQV